jgi:hypothetical protein
MDEMCLDIGSKLVVWHLVFGTWNFIINVGFGPPIIMADWDFFK